LCCAKKKLFLLPSVPKIFKNSKIKFSSRKLLHTVFTLSSLLKLVPTYIRILESCLVGYRRLCELIFLFRGIISFIIEALLHKDPRQLKGVRRLLPVGLPYLTIGERPDHLRQNLSGPLLRKSFAPLSFFDLKEDFFGTAFTD